jgi:hypothetical protein
MICANAYTINGPLLVYKTISCTYTQAMNMHYFDYYVIQK